MDDSAIIALFFERSEKAIAELSSKYGGKIYNTAFNILQNRQDAEECANDTYLSVWNAIPPQRPDSLPAFVCRIARNISVNRSRRNSSGKRGGGQCDMCLDELSECVSSKENVEAQYAAKELGALIDEFLNQLNKKNRMIFVRRYWYLDSFEQIAEYSGLRETAVRMRLSRIREKLKVFLEKRGVDI